MPLLNRFGDSDQSANRDGGDALVSWIMERVKRGRDTRDQMYGERWKEYTRLWRGFYSTKDKNRDSERSRLIAPALQQAIEMTVAEMEEAVFSQTAWFDIEDDLADQQREDAIAYRDQLLEDFHENKVEHAVSEVFLLGAIYGTGIGKINVTKKDKPALINGEYVKREVVAVELSAVRPDQFVIDPAGTCIDDALYVAHEFPRPLHAIQSKIANGTYRKVVVTPYQVEKGDSTGTGMASYLQPQDDAVLITEYCGKVPAKLFRSNPDDRDGDMIEVLVTIANESVRLKAVVSPFTMKDRPFIAYQHDTVPGEFWGRGVSEKGYNPQKALDAELRARIDALGYLTAPMLGADMNRLPRNPDMRVRPGKVFLTRGRPSEILEPIGFAANLSATFQQSGDLERMVQMGTGAMDSATPVGQNRRNETMGGMSIIQSGFIKRSKRTMQNLERNFLDPLVKKSLWRYMQFSPDKYPADMEFVVHSTMGIMAKEVENQQLVQMLGFVGPESPAHGILVKTLLTNTTSSEKREVAEAVQAMFQPPSEEDQQMAQMQKQIAIETAKQTLRKLTLENDKTEADIALVVAKTRHEIVETELEDDIVEIQAANAATAAEKTRISRAQTVVAQQRNLVTADGNIRKERSARNKGGNK